MGVFETLGHPQKMETIMKLKLLTSSAIVVLAISLPQKAQAMEDECERTHSLTQPRTIQIIAVEHSNKTPCKLEVQDLVDNMLQANNVIQIVTPVTKEIIEYMVSPRTWGESVWSYWGGDPDRHKYMQFAFVVLDGVSWVSNLVAKAVGNYRTGA